MNDQTQIETGTALALPEPTTLATMFQKPDQIADLISRIETEARAHAPDISTKKGRDAIASLAHKVARSKTALDSAGKDLNADLRAKINVVDEERRKIRDRLDALKAEVRKPLDEWEAAEEARIEGIKTRIRRIEEAVHRPLAASSECAELITKIEAVALDESFAEFLPIAAKAKDTALASLRQTLSAMQQREAEQAELARLRAEAAAREEADRQRREAEEAEARRIAAEKAEADRAAQIEREKQEAAQRAAAEAEARAKAEAERLAQEAAAREAALARQLAEAKAREEAAAQAERDRIEAERKAEADARAKREADKAHRARIQSEIATALEAYEAAGAMAMADAIIGGSIPHVKAVL